MTHNLTRTVLLLFTLALAAPTLAQTTLFEISKGDHRILVGGTIHLLHPDEYPLPEAFDRAYEEADALYLEADMALLEDPAFGMQLAQAMLYPQGTVLYEELSTETWERLERYAQDNQFPLHQFVGYDPAFVSMVMTVMEAQHRGITDGVDEHFYRRAQADELPTGALETGEQILSYMKALTGLDGDDVMDATLRDLERFEELMDGTVEAWKEGDMERLYRDLGQPMLEEAPELYQTLLVERNILWLDVIEPMFENDRTELVLVGSLHLTGQSNLLELLEDRGYQVTRY